MYPQILLGYNQNNEISDSLSCTSNYSIYTNEGSSASGFNSNLQHNEMFNNLQNLNRNSYANTMSNSNNIYNGTNPIILNNTLQNIQNSNQMINNYSNLLQTNNSNSNTSNNLISGGISNTNMTNTINASSINQTNNIANNTYPNQESQSNRVTYIVNDNFPKINLQVFTILS